MAQQTVTLGFGKASTKTQFVTYACFKVTEPFNKTMAVAAGQNRGRTVTQVGRHDHTGQLITNGVEIDNGSILLLQTKWMSGAMLQREGGLFLRLRPGAPLYNVMAFVPTGPENICGDQFIMFSGRADILNPADLKTAGIEVPRSYISRYMDRDELSECFRLVESSPETSPRPSLEAIATPTGVEMREVAQAPSRRLKLRGPR